MSESNPESEGTSPRTRSLAKRVFVVILACVVVAGAAATVLFFTSRSQPGQSRNSAASLSPSQRKVESCVTSIGAHAAEAINDLENFDESAMTTVMADFSVAYGAAEYAVLQSVVSNVAQNLMSAPWASSWKSAIKHELPTIESFCNKRYSISSAGTSSSVPSATQNPPKLVGCSMVGGASNGSEYYEAKFESQHITFVAPTGMSCSSQWYMPVSIDTWDFIGAGITGALVNNETDYAGGVILASASEGGFLAPGQSRANSSLFWCSLPPGNAAAPENCGLKPSIPRGDTQRVLAMNASKTAGVIEIVDPTNTFFGHEYGSVGLFAGSQSETILIAFSESLGQADLFACDLPFSQSNDCSRNVGIAFQVLKRMVGA